MLNRLREQLLGYIDQPHTHGSLMDAVKGLPEKYINEKPEGLPYSFWGMLEHIRLSQFDMIDFMQNPAYKELEWPKDYWPDESEKATRKMWDEAISMFQKDTETLKKIINDPEVDLFAKIPHGSGQTIFREVMQIIDHNSYHIGQLIVMRRMIGEWKG
ncbi:MAG: DinB family protein [Chlorobi bacterium]|nr:DinB family protein [Chlorobiota bacterium]MCI0716332.1 DinB family protein [Chlorobiota bacterium]